MQWVENVLWEAIWFLFRCRKDWRHEKGAVFHLVFVYIKVSAWLCDWRHRVKCPLVNELFLYGDDTTTYWSSVFCCSVFFSRPALTRSRLWPVPWTLPLCVAVMGTPTPTSVPYVSKDSEYTQLVHSQSFQHVRPTAAKRKTETPSRPLVLNKYKGPRSQDSVVTGWPQQSSLNWLEAFIACVLQEMSRCSSFITMKIWFHWWTNHGKAF